MERAFLLQEAQLRQRCKLMVAWAQKGGKGVVGAGKNAWAFASYRPVLSPYKSTRRQSKSTRQAGPNALLSLEDI